MADPLSITCGVVALATFALSSGLELSTLIRSLQVQNKQTRALQAELGALIAVLEALLETVQSTPDVDFKALNPPLEQCGKACKQYGLLIARFNKHSTESHASFRDWFKQKYLQGDVNDFKEMISAYKSTIAIAIANVNIRVASAISPRALEGYKHLMSDTTADLQEHLKDIRVKIESLSSSEAVEGGDESNAEWQVLLAEKRCAERGLEFCAQLSAEIDRLEPALGSDLEGGTAPVAQEHTTKGIRATKGTVSTMVSQLQSHKDDIGRQIRCMSSAERGSGEGTAELAALQAAKHGIEKCIQVISKAEEQAAVIERRNEFEDITLSDRSCSFTVSTVGDLVTARRINLSGESCNIGGQISDGGFSKALDSFGRRGNTAPIRDVTIRADNETDFEKRHKKGVTLEGSTGRKAPGPEVASQRGRESENGDGGEREVVCESPTATSGLGKGRTR